MTKKDNTHRGSTFESLLEENGILEETTAKAIEAVRKWQMAHEAANPRIGSSVDDFYREQGMLDEINAAVLKRKLDRQD